jgi:hypothetical protein
MHPYALLLHHERFDKLGLGNLQAHAEHPSRFAMGNGGGDVCVCVCVCVCWQVGGGSRVWWAQLGRM